MNYIKDNNTLLQYIPNVVTAVEGEADLFTKMQSHLQMAEAWMESNIVHYADIAENESAMAFARIVIADDAFRRAVPSLDLILTENGFGIVSNQTVAPASRDRINALIESLQAMEDSAIEELANVLSGTDTTLSGTIFPGFEAQRMQGVTAGLFARFQADKPKIQSIENDIAKRAISFEVLNELRNNAYAHSLSANLLVLQANLKRLIIRKMQGSMPLIEAKDAVRELVDWVRKHPDDFPGWETSDAAKYWTDYTYKNDKDSGGFWL